MTFVIEKVRIRIVGRGRLGNALASALSTAGIATGEPLTRGADGTDTDVVVLCVPDSEIASAASAIGRGPIIGHTSGASSLLPLAPHEAFSIHPLLSVAATGTEFAGASCAIAGTSDRAFLVARSIGEALRMRPFVVREADRALYHAAASAASAASNYLVALEGLAETLFRLAGVTRDQMVPLVYSALAQWQQVGALKALTGPIARGDEETVSRQREAVGSQAPELLPAWDALTDMTRELARARHAE